MPEVLPLTTIGIIVMVALALSVFVKRIGQNQVIGFIIAGFLLGPFWLNFLHPEDPLTKAFAELGLFVLLFYLGLELSLKNFLESGSTAFVLALIDMTMCIALGFLIMQLLGQSILFAIIVGIMLFCTSTAIIAKFVIDHKLVDNRAVQMAVAILILQDFLGILLLVFLTSLSAKGAALTLAATSVIFAVACFVAVHRVSKYVQEWLAKRDYGHTEVTLYALSVGLIVATLGSLLGISTALGAYFAGFALAETKAGGKIKKDVGFMRDFFLVFFFVAFGTGLFYDTASRQLVIPQLTDMLSLTATAAILAFGAILMHTLAFGIFGHRFGLNTEDSSRAAILLSPLGEFVVIIATTSLAVLVGREQFIIAPLAFLIILISVIVFQPLYNVRHLHQRFVEMLPVKREIAKQSNIVPHTPETIKYAKSFGLNAFIVLCFAWMTVVLYKALPTFGLPVPFARQASAFLIYVFFAAIPFVNAMRAFRKLVLAIYAHPKKAVSKKIKSR